MKKPFTLALLLPVLVFSQEQTQDSPTLLPMIKNGDTSYVVVIPTGKNLAVPTENDSLTVISGKKSRIIAHFKNYDKSIPEKEVVLAVLGQKPLLKNEPNYTSQNNLTFKKTVRKTFAETESSGIEMLVVKKLYEEKAFPWEIILLAISSILIGLALVIILKFERLTPIINEPGLLLIIIFVATTLLGGAGAGNLLLIKPGINQMGVFLLGSLLFFLAFVAETIFFVIVVMFLRKLEGPFEKSDTIFPCLGMILLMSVIFIPVKFQSMALIGPSAIFILLPGLAGCFLSNYVFKKIFYS
jgi:hypothetical protein